MMVYLVQGYYLLLKFQLDYSYVFDQLEFLTRCFGVKVPNARHSPQWHLADHCFCMSRLHKCLFFCVLYSIWHFSCDWFILQLIGLLLLWRISYNMCKRLGAVILLNLSRQGLIQMLRLTRWSLCIALFPMLQNKDRMNLAIFVLAFWHFRINTIYVYCIKISKFICACC